MSGKEVLGGSGEVEQYGKGVFRGITFVQLSQCPLAHAPTQLIPLPWGGECLYDGMTELCGPILGDVIFQIFVRVSSMLFYNSWVARAVTSPDFLILLDILDLLDFSNVLNLIRRPVLF